MKAIFSRRMIQLSLISTRGVSAWILPSVGRRSSFPNARLFSSNRLLDTSELQNTFCALRHGRSLANEAKIISSHPEVATIQHGLSQVGQDQAEQAGRDVVKYFKDSEAHSYDGICILTSDYLRAMETALYVAKAVVGADLPLFNDGVVFERRLRERWFGEWDGGSDVHYPDVWKDDAVDSSHTLRGVESVDSVMDRTTECVLEWDDRLDNQLVLLVAHGDVLQIVQTAFAKMDGTKHRSLEHLETATLRPIALAP
jgi:broad specificity phosphatase PhoE